MKRMHLHVSVNDIDASVAFYSHLFAAEPTVHKADYAKWMLDDPRINFAISHGRASKGIEHLGIQVEDAAELKEVYDRLKPAGGPVLEEGATTCCYAKSEKSWIADPDGIVWETFLTMGEAAVYGGSPDLEQLASANAAEGQCCTPSMPTVAKEAAPSKACCG